MKEEYKSEYWKDFQQRYQGTFGWYEQVNGQRVLVNLASVKEDILKFVGEDGREFFANPDKGNYFTFLPVERGCYEYGDDVVVVKRRPARQWRRGICEDNTTITALGTGIRVNVGFRTLATIFEDKPEKVDLTRKAATLNKSFAFVNGEVFLYDIHIGKLSPEKIVLHAPLFKQELEDLVTKHHLPHTVEVK